MPTSCHSFLHLCCSVLWLLPTEKCCSISILAFLIQQSLVLSHDVLAPLRLLCGLGGVWRCITTSHLVTSQVLWASRAVRLLHLVFYLKSNILNLILCLIRHWGLMCFWIMSLLLSMSKKISISITIWLVFPRCIWMQLKLLTDSVPCHGPPLVTVSMSQSILPG